jgi:hypothetical protein
MVRQVRSQSPAQCISTKGSSSVEEANLNFYTEKATRLIYEAAFYDDFVLVRPASPLFYSAVRQLSWNEFSSEFEEFWGNRLRLRDQLDGVNPDDKDDKQEIDI